MRARLEREGYEVESLDLVNGFDVTDPAAWERVGAVDLACLNAGHPHRRDRHDEAQRTTTTAAPCRVNVDGVVLGVRRLAQVMDGGTIVATASLAGPRRHAARFDLLADEARGRRLRAQHRAAARADPGSTRSAPGIADTPMLDQHDQRALFAAAGFPLLQPDEVAEAMWLAATSEGTGECWFVQPGREPAPFRFPNVPGPRRAGETVGLPPIAT